MSAIDGLENLQMPFLPISDPLTTPDLIARSGTLVIQGESNKVYENLRLTSQNGHCLIVSRANNITIRNSEIGPCGGGGIDIDGGTQITIENTFIHDASGVGVGARNTTELLVSKNRIERISGGVYVVGGKQIQVKGNQFLNIVGPRPRGQLVQFNNVSGGGNRITCNTGVNHPGESDPEDAINLYRSNGLSTDPIMVVGNKIFGGGPSKSGGGILLGDNGGSYQLARDNVMVNPGQYGIAVAGGNNMSLIGNQVYASSQPFNNVGLYVWNQYQTPCFGITVQGNRVNYLNKNGRSNGSYDGNENCGIITRWSENNFQDSGLKENIFQNYVPQECR